MNRQNASRPLIRNRSGGVKPLLSLLPGGPTAAQIANPAGLTDSRGNAVTCTRASTKYCRKSLVADPANIFPSPEGLGGTANATVSANQIAPDGTSSAVLATDSGATTFHGVTQPVTLIQSGATYTVSIHAKYANCRYVSIVDGNTGTGCAYDLLSGTVVQQDSGYTGTITADRNGYWRLTRTHLAGFAAEQIYFLLNPSGVAGTPSYAASGQQAYFWGAKVEQIYVGVPNPTLSGGWSQDGATTPTVTTNAAVAPDGTTTASLVTTGIGGATTGNNSEIYIGASIPTGNFTFSFYAKAVSGTITLPYTMQLAGAIQGFTASVSDSGWTLVSGTLNNASAGVSNVTIGPNASLSPLTPAQSFYVWGVRLDAATSRGGSYISPMLVSLPANVPSVEPEGLLVEGTSTNLLRNSADFTQATWTTAGAPTISVNYGIAPDGTLASQRAQMPSGATFIYQQVSGVAASGTTVTNSFWVRSNTGSNQTFRLWISYVAVADYYSANLTATTAWQRFTWTQVLPTNASTSVSAGITTNVATSALDLQIWGAQLEQAKTASSYIPTTAAQVTRSADSISIANPLTTSAFALALTAQPPGVWTDSTNLIGLGTFFAANSAYVYTSGTGVGLNVFDSGGVNSKAYEMSNASLSPGTAHRLAFVNPGSGGATSTYLDGSLTAATAGGTGTNVITTQPSTLYMANGASLGTYGYHLHSIKLGKTLSSVR